MVNLPFWQALAEDAFRSPLRRAGWRHPQKVHRQPSRLIPEARLIVEIRLASKAAEESETVSLSLARPLNEVETIDTITAKLVEFLRRLQSEGKL